MKLKEKEFEKLLDELKEVAANLGAKVRFEKGDFENVHNCVETLGISCESIPKFYYEAIAWAEELFTYLSEK